MLTLTCNSKGNEVDEYRHQRNIQLLHDAEYSNPFQYQRYQQCAANRDQQACLQHGYRVQGPEAPDLFRVAQLQVFLLATDIVVMSARPGRIKARLSPQFALSEDPAVVASVEFARMKAEIFALLREESLAAQRQEVER